MERHESLERIAGPVSRETFARLATFEATFTRWSARINLVAPSTLGSIWERHILDSAQLVRLAPAARDWVDLGSGGGFPGAVVAILLSERRDTRVRLVDSNTKKCAFLISALTASGVHPDVHPLRIDAAVAAWKAPEVVTARAVAPLADLIRLTEPWLQAGTRALFHKGEEYGGEIELARDTWNLDLIEHQSAVDPRSVVLEIIGIERRP